MTTSRTDLPAQMLANRLLTIQQTADHLQCCTKTVRRLVQTGEMPHVRRGRHIRILPDDLARYVASCRSTGR